VLQAAGPNLRTAVIRPGVVYGGNRGIVSDLLKNALNGLIRVIGRAPITGRSSTTATSPICTFALRRCQTRRAFTIANDEGDETVNAIVEGIAGHLSMTPDVRHVPLEEARKKLGAYADALALDQRVRGPRARALGWSPTLHSVGTNVPRLLEEFRRAQGTRRLIFYVSPQKRRGGVSARLSKTLAPWRLCGGALFGSVRLQAGHL
jgi:nucleoside-diphosphate-sugar epimerase